VVAIIVLAVFSSFLPVGYVIDFFGHGVSPAVVLYKEPRNASRLGASRELPEQDDEEGESSTRGELESFENEVEDTSRESERLTEETPCL
jgi:hypothetical protein